MSAEAERARLGFDLAHVSSVRSVPVRDIRGPTESGCGLLLNREDAERGGGRRDERDERYGKGSLTCPDGVLAHERAIAGKQNHENQERQQQHGVEGLSEEQDGDERRTRQEDD